LTGVVTTPQPVQEGLDLFARLLEQAEGLTA